MRRTTARLLRTIAPTSESKCALYGYPTMLTIHQKLPFRPYFAIQAVFLMFSTHPNPYDRHSSHSDVGPPDPSHLHRSIPLAPGSGQLRPSTIGRHHSTGLLGRYTSCRATNRYKREPTLAIHAYLRCCRYTTTPRPKRRC